MVTGKANIMATQTTLTSAKAWAPDRGIFNPGDVIPDALLLKHSIVGGIIEGDQPLLRVAYVDDTEATVTAEGEAIAESDPTLDEVLVSTSKVTKLVRLSREQWVQEGAANELSQSVQRAIINKADSIFLNQATEPKGLLNITGIEGGDALATNLDPLIDLIAQLESAGSSPTAILVDPLAWASIRKLKTGTGSEMGILGAGASDAQRMLLDLPVDVSNMMPANTGMVVDSNAIVSAAGPVQVASDQSVYFNSDSVALRATWRIGWNIVKPGRVGTFTVTAA